MERDRANELAVHGRAANAQVRVCRHTLLRRVELADAEFILSLRLDPVLSAHLPAVEGTVAAQRQWLAAYKDRERSGAEYYFIICSVDGEELGTVRIYDFRGDSFCWGSWIVRREAPAHTAIETALSVYEFAFGSLGFDASHFDVRKTNVHVLRFHRRFGAVEVDSDADNVYFRLRRKDYDALRCRYTRFFS